MTDPNPAQRRLIEGTEGVYLVDAGAGTGKTFALTRRYANVVASPAVEPEDVLLLTFTDNAAAEMKERIVARSDYGIRALNDAPIGTFHARCLDVLMEHGFAAPSHLGIDDRITPSTRVVGDETVEAALFREFVRGFADDHPEHRNVLRSLDDPTELRHTIGELAAKGVFPTADGWYRNGERHLDGDFAAFREAFAARNEPRNGGSRQSRLRSDLGRYGRRGCYRADAPSKGEVRGDGKRVPPETARLAFDEDRTALKAFVHDVYFEYLAFALRRNYLTFGFLQLFAFVLLCEDGALRERLSHEYVMIDEFQDTSEIQFKLALLLAGGDNLCAVGDWKQSIYSFQFAAVENVTEFEDRLNRFVDELNADRERVALSTSPVERIELVQNYRSTGAILDLAERGLEVPASGTDSVDVEAVRDRVVSLESNADHGGSVVEAIRHEDEYAAVLTKVQEIVGNEEYAVDDDGELRAPTYGDVAVLTRTRDFGRDLLAAAREHGVPVAYEGGVELFRTDQAKLLLAWLRILESDAERGWAVVLEEAGYALDEVKHVLARGDYPDGMESFRATLADLESVGGVARRVFARYGYDGAVADVLIATLQSIHDATAMPRGDLIGVVERGIETGSTHEVRASAGTDAVTVRTIHATKGLEHPVVILANMNRGRFPPRGGSDGTITYDERVGLRRRKVYAEDHGSPHVYDNWRTDVLRACLPRGYAEERRLLYVAMTRAERHLVFAAGAEPNTFLEELPVDVEPYPPDVEDRGGSETTQARLRVSVPTPDGPVGHTPHTLMRDDVFEDVSDGRGRAFGTRVHTFAERYARGEDVDPGNADERNVAAFLDSLDGELLVERDVHLPLAVDGEKVSVSGVVDLVVVTDDRVEVVDYKTDTDRHAQDEYRVQLGVYERVVSERYPDREVTADLFYTADGEMGDVDPLSEAELEARVRERTDASGIGS